MQHLQPVTFAQLSAETCLLRARETKWFLVQGTLSQLQPTTVQWTASSKLAITNVDAATEGQPANANGKLPSSAAEEAREEAGNPRRSKRLKHSSPARSETSARPVAARVPSAAVSVTPGANAATKSSSRSLVEGGAACLLELRALNASPSDDAARVGADFLDLFVAAETTVAHRPPSASQLLGGAADVAVLEPLEPLLAMIPWDSATVNLSRSQRRALGRRLNKAGRDFEKASAALLQVLREKRFVCAVRGERAAEGGIVELHLVALFDPEHAADVEKQREAEMVDAEGGSDEAQP